MLRTSGFDVGSLGMQGADVARQMMPVIDAVYSRFHVVGVMFDNTVYIPDAGVSAQR
jgi:hypothetical protein